MHERRKHSGRKEGVKNGCRHKLAEVLAMNHNACFEIEDTKAAKIVLDNGELRGCALPRIIGNGFEQIIGDSPALEAVFEQVERVAPTDSTVLIQ